MKTDNENLRGVLLAFTGFTCWVFADSSIKVLGRAHLPAYEVLGFMGIVLSGAIAAYANARGRMRALQPKSMSRQATRSGLDLVNNFCVIIALRHVSLPFFYILVFMAPPTIAVLGAIFLGEKVGLKKGAAILAGFLGVVIAVNPFASSRQSDWIGYTACMMCVACFSVNMVWSRVLTRTETPESLTLFSGLVMTVVGLLAMLWRAEPVGVRWFPVLFAMGLFCAAGAICFFAALKHTTAATVSQYHYTQLITGSAVSYLLWRELPTWWMLAGGSVIVASGLMVAIGTDHDPATMY